MRRIERLMGTVFVIETPETADTAVIDEAFRWFHWVEATFSVFRDDSEVSAVCRGEVDLDRCDPQVRSVLTRCEELRTVSSGAFDHRRGEHGLDPSAYVKGWSVDRAALILRLAGVHNYRINAGGDVLCNRTPGSDELTRVGIRHPDDPGEIAAVVAVGDGAVATSGEYERGAHLWGRRADSTIRSISVVGPELGVADALATALFAAGEPAPPWLTSFPGYGVLAMTDDRCVWTPELDDILLAPRVTSRCDVRVA